MTDERSRESVESFGFPRPFTVQNRVFTFNKRDHVSLFLPVSAFPVRSVTAPLQRVVGTADLSTGV